nr:aminotransferase class I/II-fold pyridoxal phosphate-dependent enzyme [Gammaproteobacteria bacterium]
MKFIDLGAQYEILKDPIKQATERVMSHGQFILGPEVQELEQKLANYVGVSHCVSVASGTVALQVALMALGIGPGDEVITTPFSFFATTETILLLGAKAVYVDIEPDTYNLNANLLEQAITKNTKAILP